MEIQGYGSKELNTESDQSDWLLFIRDRRWSSNQKRKLLAKFHSPTKIYECTFAQLQATIKSRFKCSKAGVNDSVIQADQDWLSQKGHHLISINDQCYPKLLKEISDPPIALFVIGDLSCLQGPNIAMVGSRRPSPVGSKIATELASQLADLGLIVTSGMALGVDGICHKASLDVRCQTVAVLGCGLDIVYPRRHLHLYDEISRTGCLISEYPLGSMPTRYSFPQRNRIVSGLSLGVIIIEAAERSGTLITARLAVQQNREVMVIPGSALSAQYRGSHTLLRDGAGLVTNAEDVLHQLAVPLANILSEFPEKGQPRTQGSPPSEEGDSRNHPLLQHLSDHPSSVDQIMRSSGLTAAEVSSMLLILEVDGVVAIADDGGYVRLI